MTEKEIAEIRRRYKPDKCNIAKVRGCYVNGENQIVTEFSQPLVSLLEDEAAGLLSVMKKTLSGAVGKNLLDLEFENSQVLNGEEHKLLMNIRSSSLEDENAVKQLYSKIMQSVKFEGSYLILLACDKYDVFSYGEDGKRQEDSSSVFQYILCSVCPIKLTKTALSFQPNENEFKNIAANSIIGAPEIGFMFPTFDDRAANIYSALFYTKNIAYTNNEFIDGIFKCVPPMPAAEQKESFNTVIAESVNEEKKLDVIKALGDEVQYMIEERKVNKDNEPLKISKERIEGVLRDCGATDGEVEVFDEKFNQSFGEKAKLCPQNIVDTKQFKLETPDVVVKVKPERSDLVKTQIIDGAKYILIRADENVEVNGININIS